jgi:hypothetical protein
MGMGMGLGLGLGLGLARQLVLLRMRLAVRFLAAAGAREPLKGLGTVVHNVRHPGRAITPHGDPFNHAATIGRRCPFQKKKKWLVD